MKLELCSFSGFKVYPGRGRWLIRTDGKTFHFLNSKCERSHFQKKNPREVSWTVLYRRKHKKGQVEEAAKKKSRKSHKAIRAVAGLSMADLMAKRNQKPEFRKAQREQAVRNAKEKAKAKEAEKKAQKQAEAKQARAGGAGQKQKAAKVVKPSAPRVGGKR